MRPFMAQHVRGLLVAKAVVEAGVGSHLWGGNSSAPIGWGRIQPDPLRLLFLVIRSARPNACRRVVGRSILRKAGFRWSSGDDPRRCPNRDGRR